MSWLICTEAGSRRGLRAHLSIGWLENLRKLDGYRRATAVNASENMRTDLFKVLVDTQIGIAATASAFDARRDFFLAEADLQAALTFGTGASISPAPSATSAPAMGD